MVRKPRGERAATRCQTRHRIWTVCGSHRAVAGSVANGAGPPRRWKVSDGTERCRRSRVARRVLAPPLELIMLVDQAGGSRRMIAPGGPGKARELPPRLAP